MATKKAPEYLDFEIEIHPREERGYPISARGHAGNAIREFFTLDVQDVELSKSQIGEAISKRGSTRKATPEIELVRKLGGDLFNALPEIVRGRYRDSLHLARRDKKGLRVKLRIDPRAIELQGLPWEFLYDGEQGQFLALGTNTPVIRYVPLPHPPDPLKVAPPLHILVVIASPVDQPVPGVAEEKRRIIRTLQPLKENGLVEFEIAEGKDTSDVLRSKLRRSEVHVLHFIGHGKFDKDTEEGTLLFEDEMGVSRPVTAEQIRVMIGDNLSVRLVVLNACEGAQLAKTDAFASVAMALVQSGIPAVLAMQFEITGDAAVLFSSEFYRSLADGYPVDAAVSEGRKGIFTELGTVEWGTPVLLMRASDGLIFDLAPKETASHPRTEVDAHTKQTRPVRFVFQDAEARYVHIAGSFNEWLNAIQGRIRQSSQYELRQTARGQWEITLNLLPGTYEYKFVVDGHYWHSDPNAAQAAPDGYGGQNSVIVVD